MVVAIVVVVVVVVAAVVSLGKDGKVTEQWTRENKTVVILLVWT